jgi:uncharacterized membrane protein
VKIFLEKLKNMSEKLKLRNHSGYAVAVAIALIFVSTLLLGYYFIFGLQPQTYSTIYVLDYQQRKAIDYPELLVIGKNNTFEVLVGVGNHMGKQQSFEVLQKVNSDTISTLPVEAEVKSSYSETIENGETWETRATVSINEVGSYYVVFELWHYDDAVEAFEFSNNYVVLSLEVVDQD